MKKTLLILFILVANIGCGQEISKTQLESDFLEYSNLISKREYKKAVDYMPTDFWNVYEKNEFLTGMERIGKQMDSISIDNLKIVKISETIESKNKKFRIITYSSDLEFDSSNIPERVIEKYKSQFGLENVKVDTINKLIEIKNNSQMASVYDENLNKWKYLEFNSQIITKVYGIETQAELKKYVR
ncbi:hypothetical protein [Aequorivita xiaoshiensis]|uniref:Uncharacterized protein n=1 Tax=Aequorivita xiaoshiensis TaxID=2874476 RepID=A0A9X1R573_9FLAO|nr:hypothetical protein [Aequorivita xiaoshiensis]MCG2432182.1 hypothetical protein [Aequorivita xiaoshiensis]